MTIQRWLLLAAAVLLPPPALAEDLSSQVQADYAGHLGPLFEHFHQNPELSMMESKTASRLAEEFRAAGLEVTEAVGGTGVVAIMKNGPGPTVMVRADMDGLPVEEDTGLAYASTAKQVDQDGNEVSVMHACGHDVHITSLVGTARAMAGNLETWSGTLMLIAQPGEERMLGARQMMEDNLWQRFGKPDYALAFHVNPYVPAGKIIAVEGAAWSGADTVDIVVHGVGGHGAGAFLAKDPVVLGSEIVLALQTVVSRDLPPREAGAITVGSFHAGTKHNIISNKAHLELTVRSDSLEGRQVLLDGIKRVATNMGRVAGMPEDLLPEVIVSDESVPPTLNDIPLTNRLRQVWREAFGDEVLYVEKRLHMGAEDFPIFVQDPYIPSTYFLVGGTAADDIELARTGVLKLDSPHSPGFRIEPMNSVTLGVEATVFALRDLLGTNGNEDT